MIQFVTTGFCLVVYARSLLRHHSSAGSTGSASSSTPVAGTKKVEESSPSNSLGKKLAWRRVHKVMQLQWRSILLSIMVITQSIYFGTVYVAQQRAAEEDAKPEHTKEIEAWSLCLITSGGEKEKCLGMAKALGIPETTVVGSLFMASVGAFFWMEFWGWLLTIPCIGDRHLHFLPHDQVVNASRLVGTHPQSSATHKATK